MDPKKWLEGIVKVEDLLNVYWDTVKISQKGDIFIKNLNITFRTINHESSFMFPPFPISPNPNAIVIKQ
jgi:hypothetical protein